jgi:hypothetical protein
VITRWQDEPITDEMLLAVGCPKCEVPAGTWCVYAPLLDEFGEVAQTHSRQRTARQALTGTPTKKCHNERYNAARLARYRRRMRHTLDAVAKPSAEMTASLNGAREFERREREELRAWLSDHWRLLVHADVRTGEVAS